MPGLLYYFPGVSRECDIDLKSMALDKSLHPSRRCAPVSVDTPDGGTGLLMAPGDESSRVKPIRYDAATQTWRQAPEGYWAGYVTATPPSPVDLERKEFIKGMGVEFCDGQSWTVPVVRCFWGATNLPQKLNLGPNYEPVKEIIPRYAALGDACEQLWGMFGEDGNAEVDDGLLMALVSEALGCNYYANLFVLAGLLGLFDSFNLAKAAEVMIDKPRLVAYFSAIGPEKKNLLLGLSKSTDGSLDSNEILTQLLANCG